MSDSSILTELTRLSAQIADLSRQLNSIVQRSVICPVCSKCNRAIFTNEPFVSYPPLENENKRKEFHVECSTLTYKS